MPTHPHSPQSTRLENLSHGPQGAVFDLEGRTIHLNGQGYASPVASLQELYRHALADFYLRSAEISRQQAAARPPVLGRLMSWIGRFFTRFGPASGTASATPVIQPRIDQRPQQDARAPVAHCEPEVHHPPGEAALAPTAPKKVPARQTKTHPEIAAVPRASTLAPSEDCSTKKPDSATPVLHVIFADRDGVHVIWQLASTKREPEAKGRDQADAKTSRPKLELTYGLDSAMARRLQDCYGQLAQLGYKIAGLEALTPAPEKPASKNEPAKPAPEAPSIAPKATASIAPKAVASEKLSDKDPEATEPRPRKSRPDAGPVRPEPVKSSHPEPPNRDPSFLPGI